MGSKKAVSITMSVPNVEVMIWYDDINLRITQIEWTIPVPGIFAWVRIWNTDIDPDDPIIERVEGQGSGVESVPGNYQVEIIDDPVLGEYPQLPENIQYNIQIGTL